MASPKAKRKTVTRPKATRPKKRSPKARQREPKKAKRAKTSPTVGSARAAQSDKKPAPVAKPARKPAKRRVVSAKPSKKPRRVPVRKPAVSARKPKAKIKAPRKPSKVSPKPRTKKPVVKKRPKLSRSPAAVRARKRRADRRYQREQLLAEAQRLAPVQGGDERRLAWGWLEMIRDRIHRDAFSVDLAITELGGGHATLEGSEAEQARRTPWMIVGRFDPRQTLSYEMLAHGLQVVADDLFIEAAVHPQRLSQIRVEFHDPDDIRREGDTVLSKIGPWEFVVSDLIFELVGASYEDPTEGSLASRYARTVVPRFYVFFSSEVLTHKSVTPWTVQVKPR
jgi:hypothetical protein